MGDNLMPIGPFESSLLLLLAKNRNPESHVAGASVLNQSPESPRSSQDIDLFHDTLSALDEAMEKDVQVLREAGCEVTLSKTLETFRRAEVRKNENRTRIEWAVDSAFRFFPTQPDPLFGYRLSIWDAATNKVLAAAGRNVIRDYVDLLYLHEHTLSLGALVWAAAAKDAGLSPGFILEEMQRIQKYTASDYASLHLNIPVDPVALKKNWLQALVDAQHLFDAILNDEAPYGCFFLDAQGTPQTPTIKTLPHLKPHYGSVRGCWPRIADGEPGIGRQG